MSVKIYMPFERMVQVVGDFALDKDPTKIAGVDISTSLSLNNRTLSLIQATDSILGGIKANSKTSIDTVEAKIGSDGNLYVKGQEQADWNQEDGEALDFIKNKPIIPTIIDNIFVQANWSQETTDALDFIKNKPTIPTDINQLDDSLELLGVQSDWNQTNAAHSDFIKNKPTIIDTAGGIMYNNSLSDLIATDVQEAIDETNYKFDGYRFEFLTETEYNELSELEDGVAYIIIEDQGV